MWGVSRSVGGGGVTLGGGWLVISGAGGEICVGGLKSLVA
jgi:hypothetical protein